MYCLYLIVNELHQIKIMDELKSTLIQHKHPRMRRKNASMIDNFLKQTFANSFLTLIDQSQSQLSDKPSLKQSEEMIQAHYKKLHNIIDSIDQHLARRLQNHENQVFSIVKGQIESMRQETKLMVEKLNEAIKQKNIEDEIWQLSNELDYFKSQTYKLFQQNKKLREEMKLLRKQVRENQIELQNSDKVMQKLKHDCMKAKLKKNKLSTTVKQKIDQANLSPLAKEMSLTSLEQKKQLKTDYSQLKEQKMLKDLQVAELPKQSLVNIKMSYKLAGIKPKTVEIEQADPLSHDFSFEQSSLYRTGSDNGLPKVNLIKVISQISQQIGSIDQRKVKHNQYVQTDPMKLVTAKPQQIQNIFSKTSCVDYAYENNKEKQIDLLKNGFYVRTYNGSKMGGLASSKAKKESQKLRYMNDAFNKSKISNSNIERYRVKTSMNQFQSSKIK